MMKQFLKILYQPYKWLIFCPLLGLATFIFGSLAAIMAFIVNPKLASFLSGVLVGKVYRIYCTHACRSNRKG